MPTRWNPPLGTHPTGMEIVFETGDLAAEHARVLASGRPLAGPVQRRPCGLSDFRLLDPPATTCRITDRAD